MTPIHKLLIGNVLLLTACSQPADKPAEVASLQTGVTSSPSTSNPSGERPRRRMDMSEAEENRLFEAHRACLEEHDPKGTGTGAGPAGAKRYNEEAYQACESKFPLPPWEMDSNNPTFKDNWHKNVQCLNRKGLKVIETEPGSWTYDGQPTMGSEEQARVEKECEQEAFGGGGR